MAVTVSHIAVSAVMSSEVVEGAHTVLMSWKTGSFCVPLVLSSDPTSELSKDTQFPAAHLGSV